MPSSNCSLGAFFFFPLLEQDCGRGFSSGLVSMVMGDDGDEEKMEDDDDDKDNPESHSGVEGTGMQSVFAIRCNPFSIFSLRFARSASLCRKEGGSSPSFLADDGGDDDAVRSTVSVPVRDLIVVSINNRPSTSHHHQHHNHHHTQQHPARQDVSTRREGAGSCFFG